MALPNNPTQSEVVKAIKDLENEPSQSTDVRINGTSITNEGVADIVTESAYDAVGNKIATKNDIPTKTSDLTNDSNFAVTNADNNFTERQTIGTSVNDGNHNIGLIVKNVRKQCYVQFRGKTDNGSGSDLTFGEIGVNSSGTPIFYNEVGSKASNIVLDNINNNFSAGQTIDHNIALDHSTATDRCLLFQTGGVTKAALRCSGATDGSLLIEAPNFYIGTASNTNRVIIDPTNKNIRPETTGDFSLGSNSSHFLSIYSKEYYAKNASYALSDAPTSNSWLSVYRFIDKNNATFGGLNGGIGTSANMVELGVDDKDGTWKDVRIVADGIAGATHSYRFIPASADIRLGDTPASNRWNGVYCNTVVRCYHSTPNFDAYMTGDAQATKPSATQSAQYLARDKDGNWMGGLRFYHTTGDRSQTQLVARSPKTSTYSAGVMLEQDASATSNNQAGKCRFIPFGNGTVDLGASGAKWRNVYGVNVYASSDRRLKENIKDAELDCGKVIDELPIKEFNFKSDEEKKVVVGAIAQELKEILPEKYRATLVSGSEETSYSINEGKLLYVAIGALKEERAKTKELEERLAKLEKLLGV